MSAVSFTTVADDSLRGDANLDGQVSITDVTALIDYLLTGEWATMGDDDDPEEFATQFEWVDLGLPSGTLWATCNVGAGSPEEIGHYFAWGEIAPKESYEWENYLWCVMEDPHGWGLEPVMTKYKEGNILESCDDAATANMDSLWCMPSKSQIKELMDVNNCTWRADDVNGIHGFLVESKNKTDSLGNPITMFMPAAGMKQGPSILNAGAYYWSNECGENEYCAYNTEPEVSGGFFYQERFFGMPVRAVLKPKAKTRP